MKWSLLELNKNKDSVLEFTEVLDLEVSLKEREPEIVAVAPTTVKGFLTVSESEYILSASLETVLTLPSTRSLKPVECPFAFDITEVYMTKEQYQARKEFIIDQDAVLVLDKDIIDLAEAVEDHLLLAIPLQVLAPDEETFTESIQGDSWELISEDMYLERKQQQEENNIDPRLAKLSALLDNSKDSDEQ